MAKKDESKRIVWWVEHPEHGLAIVEAPNWEQATVEAAKWWEVPWSKVAAMCEEKRREVLPRFVCAECGKIFYGRDGDRVRCGVCECKARDYEASKKANARRFWREMRPGAAK